MKLNLITLLIMSFLNIISTVIIVRTTEKHSTHPTYGRKIEKVNYHCEPWDSC